MIVNETAVKKGTKWTIDPAHSQIQFKVRHMMISTVTGNFDTFHSEVEMDGEDLGSAKVSFEAETASVHTGSADRDEHFAVVISSMRRTIRKSPSRPQASRRLEATTGR